MATLVGLGTLISGEPWEFPGSDGSLVAKGGRPLIWTSLDATSVHIKGTKTTLPFLGHSRTASGETFAKWELPATTVVSDDGPVEQTLSLSVVFKDRRSEEVLVRLGGGLPTPESVVCAPDIAAVGSEATPWILAAREAQAICGIHVETANECYDERLPPGDHWSGVAEGLAVRDWPLLLKIWRENQDQEEPRLALIVKIAQKFSGKLEAICRRPRKVLRRERELERPERLRQLDASCIRWLVRQPGRNHLERCGPKQRLLGVVRVENPDTPENRVARDFLIRARRACQGYLFENRKRNEKQRVINVRRFLSLVNRLLLETEIGSVGQLVGSPEPNYVLLYDQRYRELWFWYQKLRRQQIEVDSVWQWRHRVWAETCLLALGECLEDLQPRGGSANGTVESAHSGTLGDDAALRGPKAFIYLRTEQDGGQFLDLRSPIGPWVLQTPGGLVFVHLLRGENLELLKAGQPDAEPLAALSPDFILAAHRAGQRLLEGNVLAVWCEVDFGLGDGSGLKDRVDALYGRLRATRSRERVDGILLQPRVGAGEGKDSFELQERRAGESTWCLGLGLPQPIQAHRDWFRLVLEALLSLG